MRVILDFQACQSGSRFRGVGRGSRSLMLSMGRHLVSRGHEVVCLLSEAFQSGLDELKTDIHTLLPEANIVSFRIPTPCAAILPGNAWRQMASCMLREQAIAHLEPDFVHIPALLADGWADDAVASVGLLGFHIPVSLTHHDLIPLVMSDAYMPPGPFTDYFMRKLESVKRADLLLAISDYSKQEALEWLGLAPERVVNISSAADTTFWRPLDNLVECEPTAEELGLRPGFFLYAPGGFDARKNLDRLFEAYAMLPCDVRAKHQLVVASRLDAGRKIILEQTMSSYALKPGEIVLTDYLSDLALRNLYCTCFAYVLPSLHEGFGLPALEAMSCGAPVIASNRTSIPEVIEMEDALFDPLDAKSIADKLLQLHAEPNFRKRLLSHAKKQPKRFSWEHTGAVAVDALEECHLKLTTGGWRRSPLSAIPSSGDMLKRLQALVPDASRTPEDLDTFLACYEFNSKLEHQASRQVQAVE